MTDRVRIHKIPTGVPGFDDVLGGGLPEFSFNLIVGGPGCGKTTLAHQIMFASASPERPALYISILGESPLKMLRYQQQFSFFDVDRIPESIQFLHLGDLVHDGGLQEVLDRITGHVQATAPKLVFVDSFRAVVRKSMEPGQMDIQQFMQQLSLALTTMEATTFLIGEYDDHESEINPMFTVADGIIALSQATSRNSIVRKLRVVKMRGQPQIPGLHTVKITTDGVLVYPRLPNPDAPGAQTPSGPRELRRTGIPVLDDMLGGGIPAGYSVMVVGPSGSGKSVLSTQFITEGVAQGEPGVIAVFEKRPEEYITAAPNAAELAALVEKKKLRMLYLRPLDLSVDETMAEIAAAVRDIGATRVAIDSLSGFELALAPSFREDFRESLYRMVGGLVGLGVTVVMTAELVDSYTELRMSPHGISFLTDVIILQRYVEIEGALRRVMVVAKMRGIEHLKELRLYDIGKEGLKMGKAVTEYDHILAGVARLRGTS